MTGGTYSTNVISFNGFQNVFGGQYDGFLVKFNSSGTRLWGTYYGGSSGDYSWSVAVDTGNNAYLVGFTISSNNIATTGAFQTINRGLNDSYLVKFNSNGNRLWATFYGDTGSDYAYSCTTDNHNNVYISGYTTSTINIASNGFQSSNAGQYDAFLVKFDTNGNRLWGTYYGGANADYATSCAVDRSDNVYMSGSTQSITGIAFNGFNNIYSNGSTSADSDAFLVKFSGIGNRVWATYYGSSGNDNFVSCNVDNNDNVYLCGFTTSLNNIASGGFLNSFSGGYADVFLSKFNNSGSRLWSTYFGGNGDESSWNSIPVAIDNTGSIYIAGVTNSISGIALNGFQNAIGGGYDAFLLKIADINTCITASQPILNNNSDSICTGSSTTLSITSGNLNSATTWQWRKDSCNGTPVGNGTSITILPTATTTYFVKGEGGCATPGSCISKTIVVRPSVTPAVNLSASPSGPITSGTPVTFTATAVNGGTAPTFAFRVNGVMVQSNGSNTYTSSILQNGDIVTVTLNSNAFCLNTTIPPGDTITIIVAAPCIPATTPAISTNYDTVCSGATPTLTVVSGNLNSATSWQWYTDSCGGTPLGNGTSITVTPAATTTYYLRAEGGCTAPGTCVSKTIYVKQKPVVTFTATPASLCVGDTTTITFTGTAPADAVYTWGWGGGTVISGSNVGPYKVKYAVTGNIALTVNNGFCSVAATDQAITVIPAPELSFNISDSIGCDTLAVTLSANPLNINSWTWNFGDGVTVDNINTPVQHTYAVGSYTASITVRRGACTNTASRHIIVYKKPTVSFSALPGVNTPVMLNQALFNFTNASQNATQYLWRFGDNTTSSLLNPSHRYMQAGNYAVKLLAYNSPVCVDSVEVKPFIILADTVPVFTIPNAFSPNKDGINDTWMISGIQMATNAKVSIFNRWGQTVFNSVGYSKPWDGTLNGKSLPIDTYYYIITVGSKSYTGSVTLLR